MAINTSSIQNLLRPGLADVFGDYPMYPAQWSEIFERHSSDKANEIEVEMKFLGLAQIQAEGASVAFDSMGQRTITNYIHRYVGIGFIITRQAIKDNLYKNRFPMQAKALRQSFEQTKETLGAAVLNNGFDTNYPTGDGQPVFSTAHPIDGGTYANTFSTQVDLNEASLEAAVIAVQRFKNVAGLKIMTKSKKLIVPTENQFVADRLLSSQFRTSTANNDVNALYNMSSVPEGYRVNQFLSDTNAWYLMTDSPSGFKYYDRESMEVDIFTDIDTSNLKVRGIERYSFGVSNCRAAFASSGSS